LFAQKFEFFQITTIESVVPMGLGRSRMLTIDENGKQEEVKMKNFFSAVGINFGNIRKNDELVGDKLTQLSEQGWELESVNTGVYSADKSTGIFITRYLFKRPKE
jgi:hypothetical protein